jgi:hypothetical protein
MHFALLQPGDWLLIPKGAWHSTFSEQGSVAVTLALQEKALQDKLDQLTEKAQTPPQGRRLPC